MINAVVISPLQIEQQENRRLLIFFLNNFTIFKISKIIYRKQINDSGEKIHAKRTKLITRKIFHFVINFQFS